MTLQDIINSYKLLNNNLTHYYGKLGYAVNKNLHIFEKEIKAYNASRTMTKEMQEYESLRINLCKTHAKKDDNGNPTLTDDKTSFVIENHEIFEKEYFELEKKYIAHINDHDIRITESNKLLSEEIDLNLIKVKVTDEEISKLNGEALRGIMEFIELME